jgi:hypothetical protein
MLEKMVLTNRLAPYKVAANLQFAKNAIKWNSAMKQSIPYNVLLIIYKYIGIANKQLMIDVD